MADTALTGGFAEPQTGSAEAFRAIMQAMARPGRIYPVVGAAPPPPLSVAAGCILLTLCDPSTPVHLTPAFDRQDIRQWIGFHTGAPVVAAEEAAFVVARWDQITLDELAIGTPEYPDRSATLIVETDALSNTGATLKGPGIETTETLNLPETAAFQRNRALFPLGLDFFFTAQGNVAALPRSTEVF